MFGQTLVKLCEQNSRVIGITAAMATGTGLDLLQNCLLYTSDAADEL